MRLFYNKDLSQDDSRLIIDREESRHIVKVLRKKVGDTIYITNGKGILFTTRYVKTILFWAITFYKMCNAP